MPIGSYYLLKNNIHQRYAAVDTVNNNLCFPGKENQKRNKLGNSLEGTELYCEKNEL